MATKHREGPEQVKTTVELPADLWRAVKILAVNERSDFRSIVIAALEACLKAKKREGGR